MVDVAQLVRVPDCGSEGRGFESHLPPEKKRLPPKGVALCFYDDSGLPERVNKNTRP